MDQIKKTKIIATLGPSTEDKEIIEKMILEGVDVFRINFSHSNYNKISDQIDSIRSISKKLSINTSILGDLQGPKLRIGEVSNNSEIKKGDNLVLSCKSLFKGNSKKIYINYQNFARDVKIGENILVDDGKIIFEVLETDNKSEVIVKTIQGGELKSRKGINLPNTKISLPALTKKDIEDAKFSIENQFDWIALSFVRKSNDLDELRSIIEKKSNHKIPIIAKIEKPEAIKNINEIISSCDGLMVARGDLGVEIPPAEVPLVQKEIVLISKKARKPVIIATQMMENMIDNLSATRAEVNDVANSVMDGADAVMLSAETSVGNYPVEVIKTMSSIVKSVENSELIIVPQKPPKIRDDRFITKSVCFHAAHLANDVEAKAICTLTNSGYTAFQISAWRPKSHVLVFTSNERILTQLNLLWGVKAFFYDGFESTDKTVEQINKIALEKGYVNKGDLLINLTAMPISDKGKVNTLRISSIKG